MLANQNRLGGLKIINSGCSVKLFIDVFHPIFLLTKSDNDFK
jgi:hypothetical protein